MTTESKPGCHFWPTVSEEDRPGFQVTTTCSRGDFQAVIYTLGDSWYFLSWTDGLANSWREKYSNLSYALCRMGLLAYCQDSDWDRTAVDSEEAEFIARVKPALTSAACGPP